MPGDLSRVTRSSSDEEALIQRVIEKVLNSSTFLDNLTNKIQSIVKDQFKEELESYKNSIKQLEDKIVMVKKEANEYKEELEQYSRLNSLRIFGVPESAGECTDNVIVNLCKEKLGVNISTTDIDCSHRLPNRESNYKPIIVKFTRRSIKKLVYSKKKLLKGTQVVIKEDLTKQRALLLKKAATKYGPRNVWSSEGKILVKVGNNIKRVPSIDEI